MMNPAPNAAGPSLDAREKNTETNVAAAISGSRSAGSDRLTMKIMMVTKIPTVSATAAPSAVATVERGSARETNRTM